MELTCIRASISTHSTPLMVMGAFEGGSLSSNAIGQIDEPLAGQISEILATGDFAGREGQTLVVYPPAGRIPSARILLVGLGKKDVFDLERLRRAAATAVRQSARLSAERFSTTLHQDSASDRLSIESAGRAIAEGVELGSYAFKELKAKDESETGKKVEKVELLATSDQEVTELERGIRVGGALARGENLARTLGNMPGNIAVPEYLAARAREIGTRFGMKVSVLGPAELASEGMRALLAVSQGSDEEPRLMVLEHLRGASTEKPIVLVGKGLTFDSGGISIKPAAGMEEMKFDMSGGAAVLGAMQAIGELDVKVNVIAIVPSSENLLSGRAMKPGDVIRSHLGKTIEIVNTDAEGRLILADALSYAHRFEPVAMIDCATLTGACTIALGHQASAGLSNNEELLREVCEAGDRVGQRVWPLPMYDEYREQIKSDYADIKNSGGRPAGTITAAWFLREFVGDIPWVHLDIAGTAYGDGKLSYQTKGSTGSPTRLLAEWVLSRVG